MAASVLEDRPGAVAAIVDCFRRFCQQHCATPEPSGVFIITIQKNRSSTFASYVIDFDHCTIRPSYPMWTTMATAAQPAEDGYQYSERRFGNYLVCFKAGLEALDAYDDDPAASLRVDDLAAEIAACESEPANDQPAQPFCCSASLQPYKNRRLDKEQYFTDFLQSSGTHSDVVFEVKRNKNFRPVDSTEYYTLADSTICKYSGSSIPTRKMHAFKNYKCALHDYFFAVDVYYANPGSDRGNYHHMRLIPHTRHNQSVLDSFCKAAGLE